MTQGGPYLELSVPHSYRNVHAKFIDTISIQNRQFELHSICEEIEMPENENEIPQKPKRKYERRIPRITEQQSNAPNPNIVALESGLVPLVNQRLEANHKVQLAQQKANAANQELLAAQGELQQIEAEIQYRMNLIGQLKNGGMPVPSGPYIAQNVQQGYNVPPSPPYTPVMPYPSSPAPAFGVGSMPALNTGLYPDATDRIESAVDIRQFELQQGRGR